MIFLNTKLVKMAASESGFQMAKLIPIHFFKVGFEEIGEFETSHMLDPPKTDQSAKFFKFFSGSWKRQLM